MQADDKQNATEAVDETILWIDSNSLADKTEFEQKLKELQNTCASIMAKLHPTPIDPGVNPDFNPDPDPDPDFPTPTPSPTPTFEINPDPDKPRPRLFNPDPVPDPDFLKTPTPLQLYPGLYFIFVGF
uniref:Uncharacterized protein n=1 Tax=Plectus sambesii TaxID=2011161 RepID=A0A914X880_9BILA